MPHISDDVVPVIAQSSPDAVLQSQVPLQGSLLSVATSSYAGDSPRATASALSYSVEQAFTTPPRSGILAGASGVDLSRSTILDKSTTTYILNPPASETVTETLGDVPKLVNKLIAPDGDGEDNSRTSAAASLVRIAQTNDGLDHIITAIVDAHAVTRLVHYLIPATPSALRKNTVTIFAYILRSQQTCDTALKTNAIPRLVACLSDPMLDIQTDAACALTNITAAELGKKRAVEAGAMPPLVVALSRPSYKLKKMAVRVVRNIASVDGGRRAAYTSNAVQPLVGLLDSRSSDVQVQYDAVKALTFIASLNKAARKAIRDQRAVEKLKRFRNAPVELQVALDALLDAL